PRADRSRLGSRRPGGDLPRVARGWRDAGGGARRPRGAAGRPEGRAGGPRHERQARAAHRGSHRAPLSRRGRRDCTVPSRGGDWSGRPRPRAAARPDAARVCPEPHQRHARRGAPLHADQSGAGAAADAPVPVLRSMSRVTIGVGGPVGSGKTALLDSLCKRLRDRYSLAVITNDIYTYEDAEFLMRSGALPLERIRGVQTGGCPHTAIREDTSINHEAIDETIARFPDVRIVFLESGGDNLAASFSPELVDVSIYVVDVAGGDKVPRKGGPGVTRSDLLVINKTDLAPWVGADLSVMARDARAIRDGKPLVFTNLKRG